MTLELSHSSALRWQVSGDEAMAEALRLTEAANLMLKQAEAQSHIALENWANARAIELALQSLEQNSEK